MMALLVEPNLLFSLHVLLAEGSVTRAARRLGITQSSMSHRLAALRAALSDPLLVRQGSRLVPTARAAALQGDLAGAFLALEEAVSPAQPFDPRAAKGVVSVLTPDLLTPALTAWLAALGAEAPGVEVHLSPLSASLAPELAGERPSFALAPVSFLGAGLRTKALGSLEFTTIGRRGHPAFRPRMTLGSWLGSRHVVTRIGNGVSNPVDEALARRKLCRQVGLVVPSFLAGLFAVAGSDLLMNLPSPLAEPSLSALSLERAPIPLAVPPVRFAMAWHERHSGSPLHAFLRSRLVASLAPLFARPRPRP